MGASAAGIFAAEALRRHGFAGDIVVAGDEPPYDRPPLSKQVLKGDWAPERATLMPPARMAGLDARMMFDMRATGLDRDRQRVAFADGSALDYDVLVVATGAQPRTLTDGAHDAIHTLRTQDDAARLRAAILEHGELVVIGAGFIGLEVAATAVGLGARVQVVEPMPDPLAARIGRHAATKLLARHADAGVAIRTGVGVAAIEPGSSGATITLSDQSQIASPVVVVGIGCKPGTDWLAGSGLDIDNGLVCDEFCAAAPQIWAAGDVARWYHAGIGRSMRIEHRTNAQEQADAVARNILGARKPFTPVPFFWSDQYDVKLQCAGLFPDDPADEGVIVEGDPDGTSFVRAFYRDGIMVGVLGWNAAKAMAGYRREISFDVPTAETAATDEHVTMRNSL